MATKSNIKVVNLAYIVNEESLTEELSKLDEEVKKFFAKCGGIPKYKTPVSGGKDE